MIENYIDLNYLDVIYDTSVDGVGIRVSLYLAGCEHNCYNCHNLESQNPNSGMPLNFELLEKIALYITSNSYIFGLTISGGEPFYKPKELIKIVKFFKSKNINIWIYSGFTHLQLSNDIDCNKCLEYVDILVDGKYVDKLNDPTLRFRGSSNQKIIELKK